MFYLKFWSLAVLLNNISETLWFHVIVSHEQKDQITDFENTTYVSKVGLPNLHKYIWKDFLFLRVMLFIARFV